MPTPPTAITVAATLRKRIAAAHQPVALPTIVISIAEAKAIVRYLDQSTPLAMMIGQAIEHATATDAPRPDSRRIAKSGEALRREGLAYGHTVTQAGSPTDTRIHTDDAPDPLYDKALEIVRRDQKPSPAYIQRQLGLGYNKAASLIERMEREGIVSVANYAGQRTILQPTA